jgi:ankyrin repeat protein
MMQSDCEAIIVLKYGKKVAESIQTGNIDPNIDFSNDLNKALCLACIYGNEQSVDYFLSIGATISCGSYIPFCLAAQYGHLELVKRFIEMGADVCAKDNYAIRWASFHGHLAVVKYLVSAGANVSAQFDCAIHWAAKRENMEVVRYLHKKGASLGFFTQEFMTKYNAFLKLNKYSF